MDTMIGIPPEVQVKVILKERNMEAWVKLEPPEPVSPDLVHKALADQRVVFGISHEAIAELSRFPSSEPVMVARGVSPVPGADAAIAYQFRTGPRGIGRPMELDDGRVDYRELGFIENVDPDQVLATKAPASRGEPGTTVLGQQVPAKPGKDAPLLAGPNVRLAADGLSVVSLIPGQPKLEGVRVSVLPIIVIPGDVDFSVGNINFQGSVKVGGNILRGFTVKATGDVEVAGMLEGAIVEAGGKVSVKGGVRQNSVITAHGDVMVRFVDSASSITTRSNLLVLESAMHSTLTAGLAVKVGKKLIGGATQSSEFISAEQVGSPGGTQTVLDVRAGRKLKVIEQLQKALALLSGQLATVAQTLDAVGGNPQAPREALAKTRELKLQLEARVEQVHVELDERLAELPKADEPPKVPFVVSKSGFHPGTLVHFDTVFEHVDAFLRAQRLAEVDGKLSIL